MNIDICSVDTKIIFEENIFKIEFFSSYNIGKIPSIFAVNKQFELFLQRESLKKGINKLINDKFWDKTMNELELQDYDMCISNYAFSELPRYLQDIYLKKVILKSKTGYITYSDNFTPSNFNSYRVEELLKIIPGSIKIAEEPATGPNYIIMWGNKTV